MKIFVPILALVLLKMICNGDSDEFTSSVVTQITSDNSSDEFTSSAVTQIALDNKDHFSSIYETIPAVALLVTAITLQNGLSDGSIKADDFIVDFLNMGLVSLVELENFNSETADVLIKQLNRNPYKLDDHVVEYIEIMEKSFIEMHEIVEKWNILKLELREVPTKENFAKLNDMNNWNNVSILHNVNISEIILMLDDMIEDKSAEYNSLKDRLNAFVDSVTSATNQFKNVESFLLSLIPFCDFFDLIKQLDIRITMFPTSSDMDHSTSAIEGILDNVEAFIPSDVSSSLEIANKMFSWHSRRPTRTDFGFVNSYKDLKKLESDTKYSWINDAIVSIKGAYSVELLYVWRLTFGTIINAVFTPENRRTIDQLNTLKISAVSSTDVKETFKKVEECPVIKNVTGMHIQRSILSLSRDIRILLKVINALETVSISITEKHKAIITDLSAETKKEDLRELADVIKLLKAPIEVIQRGKPGNLVIEIQRNEEYITTFNNDSFMQNFTKSLECFAGIGEPLKNVSNTFLATNTLRLIVSNYDYDKRLTDIVMGIENSRKLISPLREVAKAIQEVKSANVLNHRNLSSLKPYTIPLAEAATVLGMIKRAKELKNEFALFMTDGQFIQSRIDEYTDEIFKKEFLQYWGNFDNTILEIVTFFAYINSWEEKFGNSSITGITEYGNSLKELAAVPSVELDIQRRIIAVEKFQRVKNDAKVKSALVRLDGCMWKLSKLDLQFTDYRKSLEQMPHILASVHEVFHDLAVNHDSLQAEGSTEEEEGSNMIIFWFIFVGLFAIVIISVIIWCYLDKNSIYHMNKHKCCKKEPEMKTAIEGGPPPGWKPPIPKETEKYEQRINPKRGEKSMKFAPPFPNGYPGERTKEGKPCSESLAADSPSLQKSFNTAPLKKTSASPFTDKETDFDSALGSPNTSKMEK